MPQCKVCSTKFSNRVRINGLIKNVSKRKYCFDCSPFGHHNTRQIGRVCKPRDSKRIREWKQRVGKERKQRLVEVKGGGCEECGYNRCLRALQFHHVDRKQKKFEINVRTLGYYGWEKCLAEAQKTRCLCSNCHAEVEDALSRA